MADTDSAAHGRARVLRLVEGGQQRPAGKLGRSGKPRKGCYHYPKSLLRQAYFCRGGNGVWHDPRLSLDMVSSAEFASPLGALLDQLEAEGHDVAGARIEWMTYREQVGKLCADFERIGLEFGAKFAALGRSHSVLAKAMYSDPTKGGPPPGA